ncbi:hypothetical protein [Roseibium sp. RKSG952]|uniref:hypothetical protein n=1 Tax=Roseibium sp. RKSG952 TaxID=2529384 RepID=UPI0012BC0F48|nr:hypothetical protein [Roseibium sp. RKSG952]MTH95215.1 hypothetical protein [Roseibium sp. RKSG952]
MKKPIRTKDKDAEILNGVRHEIELTVSHGQMPAERREHAPAKRGFFVPGKSASRAVTQTASMNVRMTPEARERAADHIGSLLSSDLMDEISDTEAMRNAEMNGGMDDETEGYIEDIPPTAGNLPSVISNAITETGGEITPEWHQVRHLPNYAVNQIRALGRQVFRQFTDIPVDDIQTVTTLTNDETEVRHLMAWIQRYGQKDDEAVIEFEATIPGYDAEVQLWNVQDYGFLVVKDFGGYYVYGWPGGRGVDLDYDPVPQLGR